MPHVFLENFEAAKECSFFTNCSRSARSSKDSEVKTTRREPQNHKSPWNFSFEPFGQMLIIESFFRQNTETFFSKTSNTILLRNLFPIQFTVIRVNIHRMCKKPKNYDLMGSSHERQLYFDIIARF